MSNETRIKTTIREAFQLMSRQGGSFAKALSHAWFCADVGNQLRIESAFEDLIHRYAVNVEMIKQKEGQDE